MKTRIAIIGAGPYGLSLASHLLGKPGVHLRIFGQPMSFWEQFMPKGMFLRSGWRASEFADPHSRYTLDAFISSTGRSFTKPIPLERFVAYGKWFQRALVPGVEPVQVERITLQGPAFQLALANGDSFSADAVVVAAGIAPFAWRPLEFSALPEEFISHSSHHTDFSSFAGKRVAVIGGGQSALESAALLRENLASAEVFVRHDRIHWLGWREKFDRLGPLSNLLYSWTDVGPAGISQLVSRPNYFRLLPRFVQDPLAARCIRPAGASWLPARLRDTRLNVSSWVVQAAKNGNGLALRLNDSSTRFVDHLLLATGYRVDCSRYSFLSEELKSQLICSHGYPVLQGAFESSIPGLHFVGAPAAWSFGPIMRFVAGAHFSSRVLERHFGHVR